MQLTKFTDIGLRVTMLLAVAPARQLSTAEVAAKLSVPYTHATKVVARLAGLGVVESVRGRSGGIQLTEHAMSWQVGQLTRELEGAGEVVECEGANPCPLRHGCRLRSALRAAQAAFFTALDGWTVADIVGPPTGRVLRELVLTTL